MAGYGRQILEQTGNPIQVSADGMPEMKHGGITVDWSTITAVSGADLELSDGTIVKIGDKYLRYGTILDLISQAEVQTVDLSGADDPNGGDWDLTILGHTIADIAWNVTAAALQALINALDEDGADEIAVSKTGFVYTITFPYFLGNVAQVTADGTDLTTAGSTVTITIATGTSGVSNQGKYGPVDTTATDGRQAMARGESYILNQTVLMSELGSDHPPVLEGGLVWEERLLVGGTTQPTLANVLTAFPRLRTIKEEN